MSAPLGVRGFEEGEFEGYSPTEEVTTQVRLCGADSVQLRAQEIDEAAKARIVGQLHSLTKRCPTVCDQPGSLAARKVSVKRSGMMLVPAEDR